MKILQLLRNFVATFSIITVFSAQVCFGDSSPAELREVIARDVRQETQTTIDTFMNIHGFPKADAKVHVNVDLDESHPDAPRIARVTIDVLGPQRDAAGPSAKEIESYLSEYFLSRGYTQKPAAGKPLLQLSVVEPEVEAFPLVRRLQQVAELLAGLAGLILIYFLAFVPMRRRWQRRAFWRQNRGKNLVEISSQHPEEQVETPRDPALAALVQLPLDDAVRILAKFSDEERKQVLKSLHLHPKLQMTLEKGMTP